MTKSLWDMQRLEQLRQHVQNGGSALRASVIFGVKVAGIRAKAREIGCPFPTLRENRAKRTIATGTATWPE